MDDNLKPCPFCGRIDTLFLGSESEITGKTLDEYEENVYAVVCDYTKGGCGGCGGCRRKQEDAVDAWNRRAYEKD